MNTISLSSSMIGFKPLMSRSLSFKRQRSLLVIKAPVLSCRVRVRARAASSAAATNVATCSDFYKVLALTPDAAGPDEVKRAYRSMARRYHPDACHDPSMKEESTKIFLKLHEAYETLSDPILREEYDYMLGSGNCRPVLRRSNSNKQFSRRWQEQIVELNRRSKQGKGHKEGSWGSRMRAQNMK